MERESESSEWNEVMDGGRRSSISCGRDYLLV